MVVLSDLHNSEFGAYNSELVDKVRRRWPAFICASRWAMWKPDCAPTIWMIRLRFAVKDLNKADQEALKKIPSVLSVTPAA